MSYKYPNGLLKGLWAALATVVYLFFGFCHKYNSFVLIQLQRFMLVSHTGLYMHYEQSLFSVLCHYPYPKLLSIFSLRIWSS